MLNQIVDAWFRFEKQERPIARYSSIAGAKWLKVWEQRNVKMFEIKLTHPNEVTVKCANTHQVNDFKFVWRSRQRKLILILHNLLDSTVAVAENKNEHVWNNQICVYFVIRYCCCCCCCLFSVNKFRFGLSESMRECKAYVDLKTFVVRSLRDT